MLDVVIRGQDQLDILIAPVDQFELGLRSYELGPLLVERVIDTGVGEERGLRTSAAKGRPSLLSR